MVIIIKIVLLRKNMSKTFNIRSIRMTYPGCLLIIDYGLNERTIQAICQGLDQVFGIITTYVGLEHIPMFGLIVNGQNQSEVCILLMASYFLKV